MSAYHRAFGDIGMRRKHLLHRSGGEPMPRHIDDVVDAAHDREVSIRILEARIASKVVARKAAEIPFLESLIVVPERRKASRRQRQTDHDVSSMASGNL